MVSEKAGKWHHEKAPSVLDGTYAYSKSKFTKATIVTWFKLAFSCTSSPSIRTSFRRHSRYGVSIHQQQGSHENDPDTLLTTAHGHHVSQSSLATLSIKHSLGNSTEQSTSNLEPQHKPSRSFDRVQFYQPMPHENSIRLLRINKGNSGDPLEISLEFARLDETVPKYEALSYVWGSNVTVSRIVDSITRTPIPVTRNLYDALKGVRQAEEDRVLWVDALCINQSDGIEKGTQVRKMNSIYTCAARVIVWLGADDAGDADGAFGVLCSLANTEAEHAHYDTKSHSCAPHVPEHVVDIRDYEAWRKVMMFFCQIWFTRLWVLQEIVLAQNAIFVWGDCSILWAYVGAAITSIQRLEVVRSLLETRNLQNASMMWHLSSLFRNANIDKHGSRRPGLFPFLHLLDIARGFNATDPRDKIYGLLGFPTLRNDLSPSCVVPDYSLSACEVYASVTRSFITEERNLEILAQVLYDPPAALRTKEHIDNLPSWVPNFNSKATAAPISNMNIDQQYSTGLSRPLSCQPSASPQHLRIEGAILDTIRGTGPIIPFVQAHTIHNHLQSLLRWYTNAGTTVHQLAMLLTGGRDRDGRRLSPRQTADCAAFLQETIRDSGPDSSAALTPAHASKALEWKDTIWRFITYRQAFVTQTGKYGLGPQGLEEGDTVAVLWGGQCPFAISNAEHGQWVLKGECYVEAWMERDAVAEVMRGEGKGDVVFEFV